MKRVFVLSLVLVTALTVEAQSLGKRQSIPLQLGGKFSAGDAGSMPDGNTRELINILSRPNRFPKRPPFVYDGTMSVTGLANYDDATNKASRLVAVNTSAATLVKSATAGVETWGASVGTVTGTAPRLSDYANLRGKLYMMFDNNNGGVPAAAASYDGTAFSASPFNSPIAARTVTTFNERLFLAYPRVTVTSLATNAARMMLDVAWGNSANAPLVMITSGATTLYRLGFNSTAIKFTDLSVAAAAETAIAVRHDFRAVSADTSMPLTSSVAVAGPAWANGTAYVIGDLIVENTLSGAMIFRCTTAGTSGGLSPVFPDTYGTTVTDGATLVWTNLGPVSVARADIDVPTTAENQNWIPTQYLAHIPAHTNTITVRFSLATGNLAHPTPTTFVPVDVAYSDGSVDGYPAKRDYGFQVTNGDFYYPFVNVESSNSATVDMQEIVWSEIADGKSVRAANTYAMREAVGYPTAATALGGRYLVFKRNAFWQFQGTDDPDIPIRRERLDTAVGCLGPRAHDELEDETFFIGENEIYRYRVGDDSPKPICGDGMREEIMNKGSNWVESQATYKRPLLAIDKSKLIVWVYTQKGVLYAYDLRSLRWSKHLVSTGFEVDAMLWNSNTGNFYVAFGGYGLARMSYSTTANDTVDNTANTYPVVSTIVPKPIELYDPPRYDATLEEIKLLHASTASQVASTLTASYSFDQGSTYTKSVQVTLSPLSGAGEFIPLRLVAWQSGASLTVKLVHSGPGGEAAFCLSPRFYADINLRRGEYPLSNPTAVTSTLT